MSRYIDAEALDALLREAYFECKDKEKKAKSDIEAKAAFETAYGITVCRMALLNAPTADVQEVKHGRWIRTSEPGATSPVQHCSECGWNTNFDLPYCSKCGAKMDGHIYKGLIGKTR